MSSLQKPSTTHEPSHTRLSERHLKEAKNHSSPLRQSILASLSVKGKRLSFLEAGKDINLRRSVNKPFLPAASRVAGAVPGNVVMLAMDRYVCVCACLYVCVSVCVFRAYGDGPISGLHRHKRPIFRRSVAWQLDVVTADNSE